MLASKLLFILDDLLWVLTDSQLKAIIRYAKSLSEAMEKSAQQRKSLTADSLQVLLPSVIESMKLKLSIQELDLMSSEKHI